MFMHGIVSLLDQKHTQEVEGIWQMLEKKCGLIGIKETPFPHFSWLIAKDFDWSALKSILKEVAEETHPFIARTNGLGIFSGFLPVLYIPLIRTEELSAFHRLVWERVQSCGENIATLYAPQNWMPHITLAFDDVARENISCAMQELAFQRFNWEFQVDNIGFIHQREGEAEQIRYEFNHEK